MRKPLITLIGLFLANLLIAQVTTITNGNMEAWENVGSDTEEPLNWNSNKTGGDNAPSGPKTCRRVASTLNGGNYCAEVKTGNVLGFIIVNGSLTTGKVEAPTQSKSDGYIRTIPNTGYGMNFNGRPDSLVFWYKYTSVSSDYPRVEARLHVGYAYAPEAPVNSNHPDSTMNIIARAQWTNVPNTTVSNWTRVSMPFVYVDGRTPEYILITTTSSGNQTGGSNGSTLLLDEFEAIYNPSLEANAITPTTYYVSAANGASVTVPFTLTGTFTAGNTVTAQLSDAAGSFASPVTIGSVTATASGSINATIPAGTANGNGYRVRVITSTPALTDTSATTLTIVNVSNSIAPATAQTIAAGTNGSALTVTATNGATATQWLYSTTGGGPYQAFTPNQTANTYTPNFATAGTYYVVAQSTYPGNIQVTSNEVTVNVVSVTIAPASAQSILVGVNGTPLSYTETPAGTTREWKYATVAGGPYQSFSPAETGATYTPNFAAAGNYYVVVESVISGVTVVSNEVTISVNNVTLSTGTVTGSPFQFSPSAADAAVAVPFTVGGSGSFNGGNTFTAQLSDANGNFTAPVNIGQVAGTSSGTINASIPAATPAGTGYRIRVVANDPVVLGTDNGADLVVDQFNNSIAPASTQTILYGTNGTAISVTASQTATHEWWYTTTSGSNYTPFSPTETGSTYTPNFATPGTYYVVCRSTNTFSDVVTSNEVQIDVTNGTTLTTSAVTGSPYLVSASANVQVAVNFTTDVVFAAGNEFKAQLSDANGNFTSPVEIGTLTATAPGTITATIPNSTPEGTGYRIRVIGTNPATTGTDNGSDLTVVPFAISLAPTDTQTIDKSTNGTPISLTATHPVTYSWLFTEASGIGYTPFNPAQTGSSYTPNFAFASTYYVVCRVTNGVNDQLTSQEVVVIVEDPVGIGQTPAGNAKAYWVGDRFVVDLTASGLQQPYLQIVNTAGQVLVSKQLTEKTTNHIETNLPSGLYIFHVNGNGKLFTGKTTKE